MKINKFGSYKEYIRQVYETNADGSLSGTAVLGWILNLAFFACALLGVFGRFGILGVSEETRQSAHFVGYFIGAAVVLFHIVPLFHSEYGEPKRLK